MNEYIQQNYNKDITLYDLAGAVYHNPVYLSRLYKEKTGENYLDYLTKTRINQAKELLKNYDYKVYDVSNMVGYKSNKYFSKLFRGFTGMSPTEYRENVIRK